MLFAAWPAALTAPDMMHYASWFCSAVKIVSKTVHLLQRKRKKNISLLRLDQGIATGMNGPQCCALIWYYQSTSVSTSCRPAHKRTLRIAHVYILVCRRSTKPYWFHNAAMVHAIPRKVAMVEGPKTHAQYIHMSKWLLSRSSCLTCAHSACTMARRRIEESPIWELRVCLHILLLLSSGAYGPSSTEQGEP